MRKRLLLYLVVVMAALSSHAQNSSIRGTVTDSTGKALSEISVTVKGTKRGTLTGKDGGFAILASQNDILVFSAIGYASHPFSG